MKKPRVSNPDGCSHTHFRQVFYFKILFYNRQYILQKRMEFRESQTGRRHVLGLHSKFFLLKILSLKIIFTSEELKKKVKSIFLNTELSGQKCLNSCHSKSQISLFKCVPFALGKEQWITSKAWFTLTLFFNEITTNISLFLFFGSF